ncbi:MAG: AAA family ATPase [Henriciella sp.]
MSYPQRLITVSGLPGCGKSTVAEGLSRALAVPVFSIDPIEAAMWRSGLSPSETGIAAYRVAEAMAAENLAQGLSVIIDAVNPVEEARAMWRALAERGQVALKSVEVICFDEAVHKRRIEARIRNIDGMPEISWDRVLERKAEYEARTDERLILDASESTPEQLIQLAAEYVQASS